jgi:hypothetical protein
MGRDGEIRVDVRMCIRQISLYLKLTFLNRGSVSGKGW